jgi:Xaa-Pro aminopeptidase
MNEARLIYDATVKNPDLYYATKFLAEDAFIFFEVAGKKYTVMSELEIDRARKEAAVDEVLPLARYQEAARTRCGSMKVEDVIFEVMSEKGVASVVVPENTSFVIVDGLKAKGLGVKAGSVPFCAERYRKTEEEKKYMLAAQKVTFSVIKMVSEVLAKSRIKGRRVVYRGKTLTSEALRVMMDIFLIEKGYKAENTIVSCGMDSIDPHAVGSGPIMPNTSIIVDVFPRSEKTRYYGDATRTFCKGRASDALRKMYDTVKEGQKFALTQIRAGKKGREIHLAVTDFFDKRGYHTGEKGGRMVGFFHGTGHSIGLEVHEEPARMNKGAHILERGNVMSVEPGLYYPEIGGVRIEDLVYVTDDGYEMLSSFPKVLEIK